MMWLAGALLLAAVVGPGLAMIDRQLGRGEPGPEGYARQMGTDGHYGAARCDVSEGVELARRNHKSQVLTGAGADTFILAPGAPNRVYDFGSGETGDDHDVMVLVDVSPDKLKFTRHGPHLLVCGTSVPMELIVLRQYCWGETNAGLWNNQFEEIAFAETREIWLNDSLYDQYAKTGDIISTTRLDDLKDRKKPMYESLEQWTVRSFSDALPMDWFAAYACRRDLT